MPLTLGNTDTRLDTAEATIVVVQADITAVEGRLDDLEAVAWDAIRFPAQAINPAGSPAPPGVDTDTACLSFSGTADESIRGIARLPNTWLPGSAIHPVVHLRFPTSNGGFSTRWRFGYDIAELDGNFTNAVGTYTALAAVTMANPANTAKHAFKSLGSVTMTGFTEAAVVMWEVARLAASDAADNDTNDCFLMQLDLNFQVEKKGTVGEVAA
jgi:hypothetical protein